ncbi:hypothetical protein CSAL01_03763 [Colletotrichum salicis]|uniref:Uncharacterized protein n=1 Tax=Colletotrichum salicis TaxID=1209931 RepID=A0A135ST87_9PEZI|nr:hypothetical protein CSAL01_03763 [Colletotrichum salicis]
MPASGWNPGTVKETHLALAKRRYQYITHPKGHDAFDNESRTASHARVSRGGDPIPVSIVVNVIATNAAAAAAHLHHQRKLVILIVLAKAQVKATGKQAVGASPAV